MGSNNFLSPRVVVNELRSGLPQIRGVPQTVGGFVGRALRGPVGYSVRVSSFAQYTRIFGGYSPNSYLTESVKGFFDGGGSVCYIIRVLGSASGTNAKAAVTMHDANATAIMTFTAVGEGYDANSISVLPATSNSSLGNSLVTAVSAGVVSSVALSATAITRLTVGDTISLYDSTTTTTVRAVISLIQSNTVTFQTSQTATGNLTTINTVVTLETFSVTILFNGQVVQGPHNNLRMSSLSAKNYFVTRIGGVLTGTLGVNSLNPEYVVTVTDAGASVPGEDLRPVAVNTSGTGDSLIGGTEAGGFVDNDYIGQNGTLPYTGIYAATTLKDLRFMAVPGVTGTTAQGAVSKALYQFCETNGEGTGGRVVAIIAPPLASTAAANCATYKSTYIGTSSYYAFYSPWIQIVHPATGQLAFSPPEGYVMGMIANTISKRGIAKAPAGEQDGALADAQDVSNTYSGTDRDLLYPLNVNCIENIQDVGPCVMGSRTGDFPGGDFNQLHVRNTMIYLEQSLKNGTRFVLFEPNTAATRAKVKRSTDGFLETEWRKGTLDGNVIGDAFTSVCDTSNNPAVIVKAQQMIEDVYVNIPGTIENLVINVQQNGLPPAPSSV